MLQSFSHNELNPLHLLAVVLELQFRLEVDLLRSAGISEAVRAKFEDL